MADLVTRLLLNTNDFDQNLGRSTQQVQDFQGRVQSFSSGSVAAFSKFMGVVGLAGGALTAFDKIMQSSQTTSDVFENTIFAAKGSVDMFFTSLSTGDFGGFRNGIISTFNDLMDLSSMLDDLADKKISLEYINAKYSVNLEKYKAVLTDPESEIRAQKEALAGYKDHLSQIRAYTEENIKDTKTILIKEYSDKFGIPFKEEDFDLFFTKTNRGVEEMKNRVEEYKQGRDEIIKQNLKFNPLSLVTGSYLSNKNLIDEELHNYDLLHIEEAKQHKLLEESDEKRKQLLGTMKESFQLQAGINSSQREYNRYARRVEGGSKKSLVKGGKSTQKTEEILPEGSLAAYEKELTELKKRFSLSINEGSRKSISELIAAKEKDIESIKIMLQPSVEIPEGSIMEVENLLKDLKDKFKKASDDAARAAIKTEIDEAEARLKSMTTIPVILPEGSIAQLQEQLKELEKEFSFVIDETLRTSLGGQITEIQNKITKLSSQGKPIEIVKVDHIDEATKSLSAFSDTFSAFEKVSDDALSGWLNYTSGVLSSIGQLLPAIAAVTAAKETEASVNAKAAATGAASSVSAIPIVGPALAIAAIASVVAALINIPKFAGGGIMGGNSFIGDLQLARVNSGEMILNTTQQGRLFNMLDGKGGSSSHSGGQVEFFIKGSDLKGVLKNYDKRISNIS